MSSPSDLIGLFGKRYDDAAVVEALAALPEHKAGKPSDGAQYIVSKTGGFELLFNDDDKRGAGNRQNRTLAAIFLYNDAVNGYARFSAPLPFGFSFNETRAALVARRAPDLTWVIGEGRVPVDYPEPDHDQWDIEGLTVSAHYDEDGATILHFQIQPPDDTPEWVAPDTWQKLALVPERKLDAIKLYRQQNGGGMAEAKAAIESFASSR